MSKQFEWKRIMTHEGLDEELDYAVWKWDVFHYTYFDGELAMCSEVSTLFIDDREEWSGHDE
ncbi:unnamed protein product [marine sediment metagenome]|uniref:Uncharacterized protein n=1 Tax=marine sediment metagenome TaxID=412755 RepID=X1LZA4_9ZZZZ